MSMSAVQENTAPIPQMAKLPRELGARDAFELQKQGLLTIIDVRTPNEWSKTGLGEGVLPISTQNPNFMNELSDAVNGDKTAPIGVICASGQRAAMVQRFLLEQGYSDIANIAEGMLGNSTAPGWLRTGLPVTPFSQ